MEYPCRVSAGVLPENKREYYYDEPHEYLVLIGGGQPYACSIGGSGRWDATAYYLGAIDLTSGERTEGKALFSWPLLEGEFESKIYRQMFEEGSKYRIKALPSRKSSSFFPLEVLEKVNKRMPFLDSIWREFNRPVFMHSELFGELELNKRYGYFSGRFNWLGTEIAVSFDTDEEENERCLANLEAFCRDHQRWDRVLRSYAAKELTSLANDWLPDDREEPVTEEEFMSRMKISSIEMSAEGDYTVWFDDDEMFACHSIQVCGDAMGEPNYAELAG